MTPSLKLRELRPEDRLFVSILLETTFDGPTGPRIVSRLREAGDMALELVAEDETGTIIGHISFAKLQAPAGWWSLTAVTVVQACQQQGIGSEIIREGLDRARRAGAKAVVVMGEPRFYARFGFSEKAAEDIVTPFGESVLVYPITPGAKDQRAELLYPAALAALASS